MEPIITNKIKQDFQSKEQKKVKTELLSITIKHVMAASEYNLRNTRMAILVLAKGDLAQLVHYTERAKIDFRDVIMWAIEEK